MEEVLKVTLGVVCYIAAILAMLVVAAAAFEVLTFFIFGGCQ